MGANMNIREFLNMPPARYKFLPELDLANNDLSNLSAERWNDFCNIVLELKSLQELNLFSNKLGKLPDNLSKEFCSILPKCSSLKQLNLDVII